MPLSRKARRNPATAADCASPTPLCNGGQWACRSCADLGCRSGQLCNPDGACRAACTATPFCASGFCKQCTSNAHCTPGAHTCQNGICS